VIVTVNGGRIVVRDIDRVGAVGVGRGTGGDGHRLGAVDGLVVDRVDVERRRAGLFGRDGNRCRHGRFARVVAGQGDGQRVGRVGVASDGGGGGARSRPFGEGIGDDRDRQGGRIVVAHVDRVGAAVDDGIVHRIDIERCRRGLTGRDGDR